MTQPVRIQRKRTKGFDLQKASPNGLPVVYVGRPTIWGNPFRIGDVASVYRVGEPKTVSSLLVRTSEQAVSLYEWWFWEQLRAEWGKETTPFQDQVLSLQGKNLACWCGPRDPCHVDFLLETVAELSFARQDSGA